MHSFHRWKNRILSFLLAVILLTFLPFGSAEAAKAASSASTGQLTVTFLDVGQGDAAVIQCGGQTMMIDGGKMAGRPSLFRRRV